MNKESREKAPKGAFVRLFVGFLITSTLRSQLLHSPAWRNAQANPDFDINSIQHEGKEYIGQILASDQIPLFELKRREEKLKNELQGYFPELNLDEFSSVIFPQQYVM